MADHEERRSEKIENEEEISEISNQLNNLKRKIFVPFELSTKLIDFEIKNKLGEGGFGEVYQATNSKTNEEFAIKKISFSQILSGSMRKRIMNEISIHFRLQHDNIIKLKTFFADTSFVYIVMELAEGIDLFKRIHDHPNKRLNHKETAKVLYQLSSGVDYCHQNHIIHRDIKPHNILVDQNLNAKLCDFGLAAYTPHQHTSMKTEHEISLASCHYKLSPRATTCGTLFYMAPEVIKRESYNETVDNWAVGIVGYECLEGETPFEHRNRNKECERIADYAIVQYCSTMPPGAKDLLAKLLQPKPHERLTLKGVMTHPWVCKFKGK